MKDQNTEIYDIAIIGSGSGGYTAAIRSAQLGYKTVLIEKFSTLGGTCTNVGCIPTKALLDSTKQYIDAKNTFALHGIHTGTIQLDFEQIYKRKKDVVSKNVRGLDFLMKKNKIAVIEGTAIFVDNNTLEVVTNVNVDGNLEMFQLKADKFIIATGSKPASIDGVTIDKTRIITSTEALTLKEQPHSMIVIGGGVIGVEMSTIFNRIGTRVTILEYADRLIPNMDSELGANLKKTLTKEGVQIYLQQSVLRAKNLGSTVKVTYKNKDGQERELEAEYLLVAVGRKPYTNRLGLDNTDVQLNPDGTIITNHDLQTTVPNIYAIGDVIGGPMLAHKAEEEAVFVIEHINGQKPRIHYNRIPSVVYTWPEVASVGSTEDELKRKGIAYRTGKFPFSANSRARAGMDTEGFVKVLADPKYGEVLGVHIIGARASDLIAQAVVALEYEVTADDMARISYAHPTFSEVVKEAYTIASNRPSINI